MATTSERHALWAAVCFVALATGQAWAQTLPPAVMVEEDPAVAEVPLDLLADTRTGTAPLVGEPTNGFPNWEERVIHEWINRARVAPSVEMAACGAPCGEKACYSPVAPLNWSLKLARSARFHSDEMGRQGFFDHPSLCNVVSNIDALYPGSCNGAAACACTTGTATTTDQRMARFGASIGSWGENIAGTHTDPNATFYQWLFENASATACVFTQSNGHRWNILKQTNKVGNGFSPVSNYWTMDFADGSGTSGLPKIPSGAHYPRQASSVEFWANWFDTAGPSAARVNIDGTCSAMTIQRGTQASGAWKVTVAGLASGCHRYYFSFKDSNGVEVTYPTTGSFAVGSGGACPDFDLASRPASCDLPPVANILSASPNFGPIAGGTAITLTGTNFVAGAAIKVGGVAATGVVVVNGTKITLVVPAHGVGLADIVVTNPASTPGTLSGGFLYTGTPAATGWFPLAPCRVLDTRNANGPLGGPILSANATRSFDVTATPTLPCGVPTDAVSLTVNYTVTGSTQAGEIRAFSGDSIWTGASVVSFKAGQTKANNGFLTLANDGSGTIKVTNASNGNAHLIVDVNGYFK